MIEVLNLTKSVNKRVVLAGLNIKVEPGEVYSVLAKPGGGKSMLIDLCLGIEKPTSGVARIDGHNAGTVLQRARVAYVPPEFAVYPRLDAFENLEFIVAAAALPPLNRKQINDLFNACGVDGIAAEKWSSEWSADSRQRLGLAAGIARDAKAFLLDDPTAKLTRGQVGAFADFIRRLAKSEVTGQPVAILVATGDIRFAIEASDRIGVMQNGRITAQLDPASLSGSELERRCQELVGV